MRSSISSYASADQGLLKDGMGEGEGAGRGDGDGLWCGIGEGSRCKPISSNEVITPSIASRRGEGVFPCASDWAECAE